MSKQTSWDALASSLNVNRRTLLDLRFKPGAPKARDVEEWRAFLAARAETNATARNGGTDLLPGLCSYDAAVAAGQITYADAKLREAAIADQLANAVKRKDLFTREYMDAFVRRLSTKTLAALETLPELVASPLPREQRASARTQASEWVLEIRRRLAAALRAPDPGADAEPDGHPDSDPAPAG